MNTSDAVAVVAVILSFTMIVTVAIAGHFFQAKTPITIVRKEPRARKPLIESLPSYTWYSSRTTVQKNVSKKMMQEALDGANSNQQPATTQSTDPNVGR